MRFEIYLKADSYKQIKHFKHRFIDKMKYETCICVDILQVHNNMYQSHDHLSASGCDAQ